MIFKTLFFLCVLSAAASRDLDAVIEEIYGSPEPTGLSPGSTTEATVKTYDPCTTLGGEKGECVPYYKCRPREPSGLIDIHYPYQACDSYLDECCTDAYRIDPYVTTESKTTVSEAP